MPHSRLLSIVYRQDVEGGIAAMETAITVDNSCVQAYDTLASMELHRYMYLQGLISLMAELELASGPD